MTDPPGVPAALGIEAVECLQEDGNLTVRVTGRWRRRRPEWRGPALLVIESDGMRHRFPALPEPPSLAGTMPGTWRMSFSVATELAPQLGGRAWLQLGTLVVPLPLLAEAKLRELADEPTAHRVAHAGASEALAAREFGSAEGGAQSARRRAVDAGADAAELQDVVEDLERALEEARRTAERLQDRVAEAEHRRRVAEQRAHAESALRHETEEALAERARASEQAATRVTALTERIGELEDEHQVLRRAADEAEHAAAGLRAGRAVAERRLEELSAKYTRLAALTLLAARAPEPPGAPPVVPAGAAETQQLLERERAARTAAEQRADRLERLIAEERRRWASAAEGIEEIRIELDHLRLEHATLEAPSPAPPMTPVPPSPPPIVATPEEPRAAPSPPPTAATPKGLPAPPEPQSGQAVKPWLLPLFRALVGSDPVSAGRLVLALLPAQGLMRPSPIAYDLLLGEMACVQVTVKDGTTEVKFAEHPRPVGEVQFQVWGDLGGLARLLAAGRVRRRFGRQVAKVHGQRSGLVALERLLRSPLSLRRLHLAGFRLDPGLGLAVCARMIDPAWTLGERFTIAHQLPYARTSGVYLEIADGRPPAVSDRPPAGEPSATIVGPGDGLLPALAGARGENLFARGDQRSLALIAQWLDRAQSA